MLLCGWVDIHREKDSGRFERSVLSSPDHLATKITFHPWKAINWSSSINSLHGLHRHEYYCAEMRMQNSCNETIMKVRLLSAGRCGHERERNWIVKNCEKLNRSLLQNEENAPATTFGFTSVLWKSVENVPESAIVLRHKFIWCILKLVHPPTVQSDFN